jgi:AraC family transcriptional regulator of adaptative response/methylated-DNA-[protein]-cysteine methyltransferase
MMTATKLNKQHEHALPQAEIYFTIGESSLGPVLAAASAAGLCAVLLGDDPTALTGELEQMFPGARLVAGGGEVEAYLEQVISMIEEPGAAPDIPLDAPGTEFQQQVWQALRQIPVGQTMSYGEIARQLGRPRAARAVGGACAANPLSVVIPCHRAVGSDGGLTGYGGGIQRKKALLEREGVLK